MSEDTQDQYGRGQHPNSRKGQVKPGEKRSPGRPKGSRNKPTSAIARAMRQKINGSVGGIAREMSAEDALILRALELGSKGNLSAIKDLLNRYRDEQKAVSDGLAESRIDFTDADRDVIAALNARMLLSRPPGPRE